MHLHTEELVQKFKETSSVRARCCVKGVLFPAAKVAGEIDSVFPKDKPERADICTTGQLQDMHNISI